MSAADAWLCVCAEFAMLFIGFAAGLRSGRRHGLREAAAHLQATSNAYSVGSFIVDLDPEAMMDAAAQALRDAADGKRHPPKRGSGATA